MTPNRRTSADKRFGSLAALRGKPIPDQVDLRRLKRHYREGSLVLTDRRAKEPLLDIAGLGLAGRNLYGSGTNPPYYQKIPGSTDRLLVRRGVGERLQRANRVLAKAGLELFLSDAWRPDAVQRYFHDMWMPNYLRASRPSLSAKALMREVEKYWAAPTEGVGSPAPHATGGAVDLTIRWKECAEPLWMGSLIDETSSLADLDYFERKATASGSVSDDEARANRRLLYWVMRQTGFAANPSEWWHYGFGELMWSALTGAGHAFYGVAAPGQPR
jgi:zinc D-Ala-D-Ala dipeptidase